MFIVLFLRHDINGCAREEVPPLPAGFAQGDQFW